MANDNSGMTVDTALVRRLAELLDETGLSEIEVEDAGRRIRVARQMGGIVAAAPSPAPPLAPSAPAAAPAPENDKAHPGAVKSPMVGTAYLTAEPGTPPFVKVGDSVAAGDTLLIVEAMKVMNPILAPKAGTVLKILAVNEQPVEFDEVLLIVA